MKEQQTIKDIEMQIDHILFLLNFGMGMERWTMLVSKYHALCIKWHQMRGEQPIVMHGKSDYII